MTQRRNKPRHAMYAIIVCLYLIFVFDALPRRYGVTAGGGALASSVASAFEGVLVSSSVVRFVHCLIPCTCQMKPIEGAESEGALGFFKGVGKGLVG